MATLSRRIVKVRARLLDGPTLFRDPHSVLCAHLCVRAQQETQKLSADPRKFSESTLHTSPAPEVIVLSVPADGVP